MRSTATPSRAAGFGYTGVRGLNVQVATISTPTAAPVIARARLRKGNTASATGAGRLLAQALSTRPRRRSHRTGPGSRRLGPTTGTPLLAQPYATAPGSR